MQTDDKEPYLNVRTSAIEVALPYSGPPVGSGFLVPAGVLCVERTDSVGSPQHLAFFLGPKPDSSSPEQLVPGTLTVLSPRKSLF